jgi:CBS domain-containing protein
MDIADIVSTEYEEIAPDERAAKLPAVFEDPGVKGVVVVGEDGYAGVVTRRQLATSRVSPDRKVASLVWNVPRVAPDEDVREVARLMIDGDTRLLPVFDGERMVGVVTGDDLLRAVEPFLDAATVGDAYTADLVSVAPETTFGEALNVLREHRVTHLPVVEGDAAVGVLSLYDVMGLSVRATSRSQGGDAGGTDAFGGTVSEGAARTHGGFGAREGDIERILDLPVRDVMVSPVRTIQPEATLAAAVAEMFDAEVSSLVVVEEGDRVEGIVTKTDVLDALTWEAEGNRAVQVYGADLMDDVSYDRVVEMIDRFDEMDEGVAVLDAKVHLHEHDETLRGTPLLLARVRLYTDGGMYLASGEGYGARHALNEARDALERQIRDRKTYAESKKHPDAEFWEKRFGWWLES